MLSEIRVIIFNNPTYFANVAASVTKPLLLIITPMSARVAASTSRESALSRPGPGAPTFSGSSDPDVEQAWELRD